VNPWSQLNLKPEPPLGLPSNANQKAPIVLKLLGFLSLAKEVNEGPIKYRTGKV